MSRYYGALERLSPENRERLRAVEWLVSSRPEDRKTGRTTLLALAFVREAAARTDPPVVVFDHVPGRAGSQVIRTMVQSLAPEASIGQDGKLRVDPIPASPVIQHPLTKDDWKGALESLVDDLSMLCEALGRYGVPESDVVKVVRRSMRSLSVREVLRE